MQLAALPENLHKEASLHTKLFFLQCSFEIVNLKSYINAYYKLKISSPLVSKKLGPLWCNAFHLL